MNTDIRSLALANIVRAEIITEEASPRVMTFMTGKKATATPKVSQGSENELRIKNTILANNDFEDIVTGYEIALEDSTFTPDVFALIDGGTSTENGDHVSYAAPVAGSVVERTKFTLALYAAEKDYDGSDVSYVRFMFPHCKGTPATITCEDGAYYAPSYTIKSRPSMGESPASMEHGFKSMPQYASTTSDIVVPDGDGISNVYVATAPLSYSGKNYNVGDIIIVPSEN